VLTADSLGFQPRNLFRFEIPEDLQRFKIRFEGKISLLASMSFGGLGK
jgi:hypothetical protein